MESNKALSESIPHPALVCLVCGDIARGMNFEVMTCMSCKAFFRRNALRKSEELQCPLNSDCIVNQQTRSGCSACRLRKCFALGMKSDLIRSSPQKSNIRQTTTMQSPLPQPTTISLLSKDRSTLTFDQWNLLSNILQAYDEQNLIVRTENALRDQSSLPLKIRTKVSHALDIIGSFYTFVPPFLQRFPHFRNLPNETRRVLLQNNLTGLGAFNAAFVSGEVNVYHYDNCITVCNEIYGADLVKEFEHFLARRESNTTLVKLMMVIIAFSSNCSIVHPDHSSYLTKSSTTNSIMLIRIQDIFIGILWKYLDYQYGFIEAVRRLDKLVKYHLDLLRRVNEMNSKSHADMLETIIRQATESLTWNN